MIHRGEPIGCTTFFWRAGKNNATHSRGKISLRIIREQGKITQSILEVQSIKGPDIVRSISACLPSDGGRPSPCFGNDRDHSRVER